MYRSQIIVYVITMTIIHDYMADQERFGGNLPRRTCKATVALETKCARNWIYFANKRLALQMQNERNSF